MQYVGTRQSPPPLPHPSIATQRMLSCPRQETCMNHTAFIYILPSSLGCVNKIVLPPALVPRQQLRYKHTRARECIFFDDAEILR